MHFFIINCINFFFIIQHSLPRTYLNLNLAERATIATARLLRDRHYLANTIRPAHNTESVSIAPMCTQTSRQRDSQGNCLANDTQSEEQCSVWFERAHMIRSLSNPIIRPLERESTTITSPPGQINQLWSVIKHTHTDCNNERGEELNLSLFSQMKWTYGELFSGSAARPTLLARKERKEWMKKQTNKKRLKWARKNFWSSFLRSAELLFARPPAAAAFWPTQVCVIGKMQQCEQDVCVYVQHADLPPLKPPPLTLFVSCTQCEIIIKRAISKAKKWEENKWAWLCWESDIREK